MAEAAVPCGVHPPVSLVVECVVYWMVMYFEEGNVEVAVEFAAFAVGCAGVVVAESEEDHNKNIFIIFNHNVKFYILFTICYFRELNVTSRQ